LTHLRQWDQVDEDLLAFIKSQPPTRKELRMILGMSLSAFTLFHVVLSLIGIVAGFVAVAGLLGSRLVRAWTAVFLAATVLTSVTGFMFPFEKVLPSHVVGVVSLVVLAFALVALYGYRLERSWRWIYAVTALIALYLNVFVLVAQAFAKVRFLNALGSTPSDPAFIVAQLMVLVLFIVLGFRVVRSFHPEGNSPALRTA
jgi:hypothetical protein